MKFNYVYRITNKELNKHYYGVRSSKVEPKLDLGIKYFSSSKDKEFINEQKVNSSIFKYKVIKTFETREEAINLEIKLHNKFDVGRNKSFYNRSRQSTVKFDTNGLDPWNKNKVCLNLRKPKSEHMKKKLSKTLTGKKHSEDRIKINSESKKGFKHINKDGVGKMVKKDLLYEYLNDGWFIGRVPFSKEHKENISKSQKGKVSRNKGKKHSNETKLKISNSTQGRTPWNKGVKMTDDQKKKLSIVNTGKRASEETKLKMSIARAGRKHTEETKLKISKSKSKKI